VVVGAGYIAVELAGILNALGSDVSLLIRYDKVGFYVHRVLKNFHRYFMYYLFCVYCT